MLFKENQKLTLVFISKVWGRTASRQITTTRQVDGRQAYMVRRGSKEYYLHPGRELLVFNGWDLPFEIDGVIKNDCINFISNEPATLRNYIEQKNINELFSAQDKVMYVINKQAKELY